MSEVLYYLVYRDLLVIQQAVDLPPDAARGTCPDAVLFLLF